MATPLAISKLDIESILHNNTLSQDIKESILELFQINYALNEAAILAITDENGIIVYVNDEFCRISKYTKEEALGKTHRIINSGFHSKAFFKDMWETIKSGKTWRGDIKNKSKDGDYYWLKSTIVPFACKDGKPFRYISIRSDITEQKANEEKQEFLAEAGKILSLSLNYKKTLRNISDLAVKQLADWCSVDLFENGQIKRLATSHIDPQKLKWAKEIQRRYPPKLDAKGGAHQVIKTGKPILVTKITEEMIKAAVQNEDQYRILKELDLKSYMVVPLRSYEETFGSITFVSANPNKLYTQSDLLFAEELAHRASMAIQNAKLYQASKKELAERKKYEQELEKAQANYQDLYDNAPDGYHSLNQDGIILSVNKTEARMFDCKVEDMIGKDFCDFLEKTSKLKFKKHLKELQNKDEDKCELYAIKSDGTVFPISKTATIRKRQGKYFETRSLLRDITERKKTEEQIHNLAYYDPLTHLPNRRLMNDRLELAVTKARREKTKLALMFIDLDRFKHINDTLGHDAGDMVLVEVSNRLKSCLRKSDTVSRQGGDEFTILVPDLKNKKSILVLTDKIIKSFSEPMMIKGNEFYITPSIGISIFPDDADNVDKLMMYADTAMYVSKKKLGNTSNFYNSKMSQVYSEHLEIEKSLRKSITRNELRLYYQPKQDLIDKKINGMEALIRWNHPKYGVIPPSKFIPVAEETGLICKIGEWVLLEACNQLKKWHESGYKDLRVSVNVSIYQLKQNFEEILVKILNETKIEPTALDLEITESIIMQDKEEIVNVLNNVKKLGVSLSIDDFGTGYSSLNRITNLPIDILKIDKSFVDKINLDEASNALIRAIIAIAKTLNLRVVAEGVEKLSEADFLCKEGCHEIQGYYVSPPVPAEEFNKLLKSN